MLSKVKIELYFFTFFVWSFLFLTCSSAAKKVVLCKNELSVQMCQYCGACAAITELLAPPHCKRAQVKNLSLSLETIYCFLINIKYGTLTLLYVGGGGDLV
jgi:hypothetical protein